MLKLDHRCDVNSKNRFAEEKFISTVVLFSIKYRFKLSATKQENSNHFKQFQKKKRELNHARPFMFICDEAEVSADGAVISSDEDENDSDMNSFVNDASQLTQLATQGITKILCFYLKERNASFV